MKEGPQPPRCILQACDNVPANGLVGYCAGHEKLLGDGSNVTAPLVEPDDPALLERLAKKAAAQEEQEYAERRRVKTWKTLENGTRTPEEFWTDEELLAIEAEARQAVGSMSMSAANDLIGEIYDPDGRIRAARAAAPDPEKAALKTLKKALRGKMGYDVEKMVWGLVKMLDRP